MISLSTLTCVSMYPAPPYLYGDGEEPDPEYVEEPGWWTRFGQRLAALITLDDFVLWLTVMDKDLDFTEYFVFEGICVQAHKIKPLSECVYLLLAQHIRLVPSAAQRLVLNHWDILLEDWNIPSPPPSSQPLSGLYLVALKDALVGRLCTLDAMVRSV
jgi:hypothetical protein